MSVYQIPRLWTPSIKQGYARSAGESTNPGLYPFSAWSPLMGFTGETRLKDLVASNDITVPAAATFDKQAIDWQGADGITVATSPSTFTLWGQIYLPSSVAVDSGLCGWQNNNQVWLDWFSSTHRWGVQWAGSVSYGSTLTTDEWHDYCFVAGPNDCELWVNGTLDVSVSAAKETNDLILFATNLAISKRTEHLTRFYGYVDRTLWGGAQQLSQDPLAPFRLAPLTVVIPGEEAGVTVPALDEGMLVGGLQGLQGGI